MQMKGMAFALLSAAFAASAGAAGYDEPEWPVVATDYTAVAKADYSDYTYEKMVELMKDWQTPLESEVKMVNGAPEFFVNGKPRFMLWGTSTKYDNKGVPYSFCTVWNYSYLFNPAIGKWDFSVFDRNAYAHAKHFPGAMFIWQLQVYPPRDWGKKYKEDRFCDEKGERAPYWGEVDPINTDYSFASDRARDYMICQVTNAIAYLEKSPYANRIAGYRVASANGVEWFCPSAKWKRIYDHSPHARRKFKDWCRTRYPQLKAPEPPTWDEMNARDDGAILWDREKHLAASAFCEFYSEINERFMLDVAAAAKKAAGGKKAVGAYHGYTFYMNWNGYNQQAYTFDFKQTLDAGVLGMVMSPNSYNQRRPGGSFADMKPFGTLRMNGILSVCENDNRTSYGPRITPDSELYTQMPNQYLSHQLIRRDLSFELCRRNPLHHLNHPNSWYMDGVVEDMKTFRKLGDKLVEHGLPFRKAEVALVVSEKSVTSIPRLYLPCDSGERIQKYMPDGTVKLVNESGNILNTQVFVHETDKWMRSGAPVDYLLAEDLEKHPGDYRLYVFLYDMHYDEGFRRAVAKLRDRGATMLWTWAPGWSTGTRSGVDCMEELTGIRFAKFDGPRTAQVVKTDGTKMGMVSPQMSPLFYPVTPCDEVLGTYDGSDKPGLAVFQQGKSTVFFSGTWQLDMDFIQDVIRRARVFTYVDSHDPIEANEKLFALHARSPGQKTVKLPRRVAAVYDVFGKKTVAENTDSFTFEAPLHSSWLFYLKPASGTAGGGRTVCSDGTELPGADGTRAPVTCAPFPDRLSAFVWRNWFCVDKARLAKTVGATPEELTAIATEMGLPAEPTVLPEWRRTGYMTVLRRNWHLLDYDQLLTLLDMTADELRFKLLEEDFLWIKFGCVKPRCGALRWSAGTREEGRAKREELARILKEEGVDAFDEEPRFTFQKDIARTSRTASPLRLSTSQAFDFRMVSPYFADYADPFGDPEVKSCPDGLLEKLSAQGVNAVWFHVVLGTLATDPKYPEFGIGAEKRIEALRGLVARAKRYGIDIYLYVNEPRAQPLPFFEKEGRAGLKGVGGHHKDGRFTMCTSVPETRRWLRDSLAQVFRAVPGLGGVFTITMSENDTSCVSRGHEKDCPRCSRRRPEDVVVEVNRTIEEGVHAGNPEAKVIVWNWAWDEEWGAAAVAALPRDNVRALAVSEYRMPYERGGVKGVENDYSISIVGPGESARKIWRAAAANGIGAAAKVQANCSWELCDFPYLPVMDLVAEHALNLRKEGVRDVMMAWSLGGCPSPNLRIFSELRDDDADAERMLDRIAADEYGAGAVKAVRKAWTAFSDGFREYPFHVGVIYYGPQQWGPANPLYARKTGYGATMVGFPYDGILGWKQNYPPDIWSAQMQKVADGFAEGSRIFAEEVVSAADDAKRAHAVKEGAMFRAQTLHFAACADQMRFIVARDAGDRDGMRAAARRELARAKEMLELTRRDSRFGYESSNHYYYIPQDLREKILCCREILSLLAK